MAPAQYMCHGQGCRVFLGMGNSSHLLMTESLFHGYIGAPTDLGWWVYPLLCGNNGSLDPGTTRITFLGLGIPTWIFDSPQLLGGGCHLKYTIFLRIRKNEKYVEETQSPIGVRNHQQLYSCPEIITKNILWIYGKKKLTQPKDHEIKVSTVFSL